MEDTSPLELGLARKQDIIMKQSPIWQNPDGVW